MLAYAGNVAFEDADIPVPGKSEWGADTLERRLRGSRALLPAFLAGLRQGQTAPTYPGFYLQSWSSDSATPFAEVTLNYKGLLTGTPPPDIQTEIVPAVGTVSADYSAENEGLGRIYKTIAIWKWSINPPTEFAGIGIDEQVASRVVYTTGASMEFTYDAVQTRYRYVRVGRPGNSYYSTVDSPFNPVVKRVRITTSDGAIYGAEKQVLFSLAAPVVSERVVSFSSKNIIGSPFYECEDVVRRELGQA